MTGIAKPELTKLIREWKDEIRDQHEEVDHTLLHDLWELPEREYHYAALDLLMSSKKLYRREDMEICEYLLTHKQWWDTIDMLATHVVGELITRFPELIDSHIRPWAHGQSHDGDMWLRRTSILCQLKFKGRTDTSLLSECIRANSDTKEFFLNKAIGWALREYSGTDADWVKAFIGSTDLHSLSVREGSRKMKA